MRSQIAALAVAALTAPSVSAIWTPEVGERFPDLELPTLQEGVRRSIADYRGEKVLLHVFASW